MERQELRHVVQHGALRVAQLALVMAMPAAVHALQVVEMEVRPPSRDGSYAFEVEALLDSPPEHVREVILSPCSGRAYNARVLECRPLKAEGDSVWVYSMVGAPIVQSRDYTVVRTLESDLESDGTGVLRINWDTDPAAGPSPRRGAVRMTKYAGGVVLTGVDGGRRSWLG